MRKRAGALIINNKKLLLVTGGNNTGEVKYYWTPGGGLDGDETYEEALTRELNEELHVKPVQASFYCEHISKSYKQIKDFSSQQDTYTFHPCAVKYYLVTINQPIRIGKEISETIWADKQRLTSILTIDRSMKQIVKRLSSDHLI